MARRRRKNSGRFGSVVFGFIILCILGFVGYMVISSSTQRTAVIGTGNMGNQYTARAVVVRNETLTDAEGLTSIKYYADEGELVYKGNKIAEVYSTGYSQTDINKLLNTRSKIKTHVKTMLASAYVDTQLDWLTNQSLAHARELELLVRGKAKGNLLNLERQLASSLTRRQDYLKEKYNKTDTNLAELYKEESSLQKKIQSWTATYLAERDCIISFYTDGWENVLDTETFNDISAAQVHSILAGDSPPMTMAQRGRTSVFRQVDSQGWYLLLLSSDKNWSPTIGNTYKVKLQGFGDMMVDATVTSFSQAGTEMIVRMAVNADVRPVLNVRTASALVSDAQITGLQVPLNAVWQQGGYDGVVLTDNGGLFVPVEIVRQDNASAVIKPLVEGTLREGQKIKLF